MAFKMKGHALPGIKQSPTKLLGIAALTAAMIAKAAIGGAASAVVGKGISAAAKGSKKVKAKRDAAQNKASEAIGSISENTEGANKYSSGKTNLVAN